MVSKHNPKTVRICMSNTRRRFLGALSLVPLTFAKSNLVFGQTSLPKCETENLEKGAWRAKITAQDISITLINSQNHFKPAEALSIYAEYKDSESPSKPSYLDVYADDQFVTSAFGSKKAPLNPEIKITIKDGRPNTDFVVNDILQNIDIPGNTIRYESKEPGQKGQYIVNGRSITQSSLATLHLMTDGASPNINKVVDADISQSKMKVSFDFDPLLLSQKLILAYTFEDRPMYYLDIPSKGLLELIKESLSLHIPLTKKLAQNMCEYDDCFVTSATCGHIGLTDDCWELTQLRAFRDNYLLTLPNGKSLVDKYYDTAPKLLQVINNKEYKSNILLSLYFKDILPSAILARFKLNKLALWRYKAMMKRLEEQYLNV